MDNSKEESLISTPINSIKERSGIFLLVEGNQAYYLFGGMTLSLFFIVLGSFIHWPFLKLLVIAPIPTLVMIIYLVLFHIGKPPGYEEDFRCLLIEGKDLDIDRNKNKSNPFIK